MPKVTLSGLYAAKRKKVVFWDRMQSRQQIVAEKRLRQEKMEKYIRVEELILFHCYNSLNLYVEKTKCNGIKINPVKDMIQILK